MKPPSQRKERILAMGGYGSGKTSAWLNIAKWSQVKGDATQFYAIDTDGSLEAMLDGPPYDTLQNVHVYPAFTFEEMVDGLGRISTHVTPEDWTVVDIISFAWEAVQTSYIDQVFHANMSEFFLEARKAKAGGNPLDGWKDWSVINRMYKDFVNTYSHRIPGHKFMVATTEQIRDSDDRGVKSQFGQWGVRPGGQKHLGNLPHTVLLFQAPKPGEVFVNTVKDRQRESLTGVRVNEFAIDYLVNVAGWEL